LPGTMDTACGANGNACTACADGGKCMGQVCN
jgi:hypothetical protein